MTPLCGWRVAGSHEGFLPPALPAHPLRGRAPSLPRPPPLALARPIAAPCVLAVGALLHCCLFCARPAEPCPVPDFQPPGPGLCRPSSCRTLAAGAPGLCAQDASCRGVGVGDSVVGPRALPGRPPSRPPGRAETSTCIGRRAFLGVLPGTVSEGGPHPRILPQPGAGGVGSARSPGLPAARQLA